MRAGYGFCPLVDVKLSENMLYMRFHCFGRYTEAARNFLIGLALGNQLDDIVLANTQGRHNYGLSTSRPLGFIALSPASHQSIDIRQELARISCASRVFLKQQKKPPDLRTSVQHHLIDAG